MLSYENRPDFGPIFGANLTPGGSIWTATGPGAPHGETKEIRIVSFFVILGASGRKKVPLVQARRKIKKIEVKKSNTFRRLQTLENQALACTRVQFLIFQV